VSARIAIALDGRASVVVRYEPAAVEVEVANDGRPVQADRSRAAGHGLGLVGMRERAALYGGSFEGGPRAAGGFLVRAQLPLGSG
jgi:signal transduction histidine kinase